MSIIKSSDDHLTFNADGTSKNILFQADGVQKASISSAGLLTSTTIDATVLTGNLPAISAASLTNIPAANITGTIAAVSGVNLTALNASNLGSGTVPTARLGSGTASSGTFLRGDSTYAAVTSVGGATGADFNDDVKLRFGTGNDLEIYHNASNSIIKDGGTGALAILASDFQVLNAADSEYMIRGVEDGAVNLYHNGVKKFNTASAGIELSGGIDITDGDIVFATAGRGICLGVTGNTDANTLDDYEEGSWTPDLDGENGTASWYNRVGRYQKVGNTVNLWGFMQSNVNPAFGNSALELKISGIPFAATGIGYAGASGTVSSQAFRFEGSYNSQSCNGQISMGIVSTNMQQIDVTQSAGSRAKVLRTGVTNGFIMEWHMCYDTTA